MEWRGKEEWGPIWRSGVAVAVVAVNGLVWTQTFSDLLGADETRGMSRVWLARGVGTLVGVGWFWSSLRRYRHETLDARGALDTAEKRREQLERHFLDDAEDQMNAEVRRIKQELREKYIRQLREEFEQLADRIHKCMKRYPLDLDPESGQNWILNPVTKEGISVDPALRLTVLERDWLDVVLAAPGRAILKDPRNTNTFEEWIRHLVLPLPRLNPREAGRFIQADRGWPLTLGEMEGGLRRLVVELTPEMVSDKKIPLATFLPPLKPYEPPAETEGETLDLSEVLRFAAAPHAEPDAETSPAPEKKKVAEP